jgi:hypothetical protein
MPVKRPKTSIVQLKVRLNEPLRARLDKSARQREPRGISLNSEIVNRLEQSFHWDQTLGDTNKMLADARKIIAGEREAALRQWGFLPVGGRPGVWVESDKIKPDAMLALNPELESFVERIVTRTLEKAKDS